MAVELLSDWGGETVSFFWNPGDYAIVGRGFGDFPVRKICGLLRIALLFLPATRIVHRSDFQTVSFSAGLAPLLRRFSPF